jgi:antitoxin (DNA-binding transcriptional repressor) of toxin-antitoxin stability system
MCDVVHWPSRIEKWKLNGHIGSGQSAIRLNALSAESAMHTFTAEDVACGTQRVLEAAERGEPSLVSRAGRPIMLAVPLRRGLDTRKVRLELAAQLVDHEQISVGAAARIAGPAYSEMIDELAGMAVIRLEPGEGGELAAFRM